MVFVGSDAIRTGSVLLIVIYHTVSVPLTLVGTVRINSSSRGWGWQRRGWVTWRYMAEAAPQVARRWRLMPLSRIAWGPVAPSVWRRRGVVIPFVMSGTALGNLDMDAFALKFCVVQSLDGIHGLIIV